MSQELYEQPRQQISQGDILELAPHIFLDSPLLALHNQAETIYGATAEPYGSFDDKNGQKIIAHCKRMTALILTHDCEIDKPQVVRWHICPVVPLERLRGETQDRAKRNRIYSMCFLPKFGNLKKDSFVDFNHISTVSAELLRSAPRILSLSDLGRQALYAQFIRWFSRWELRSLECPGCKVEFDPTLSLSVRPQ